MRSHAVALHFIGFGILASAAPQTVGIFLAGHVVMEDGSAPPQRVTIETVCAATRTPQGYTDHNGGFSFRLNQNAGVIQDASIGPRPAGAGGTFTTDIYTPVLNGCELRAVLTGYRSDSYPLASIRGGDNVNIGTLVLHPVAQSEGADISSTSLAAPKDAKIAFDKGKEAMKLNKSQEARKQFQKAVDVYPQYADAWLELGKACEADGKPEDARKAYAQSIEASPKLAEPYLQLAGMALRKNDWQEVADKTAKAIDLSAAEFPSAYFYNAMANFSLKNFDAAEKSVRAGLRVDRQRTVPKLERMLGTVLAGKQDYAGAAQALRSYLEHMPLADDAEIVKKQLAQLDAALAGK